MVKIRLMRVGKTKQPSYRVVVADSRSPRDGKIIEAIGHYNPRTEPSTVEINTGRAVHWLRVGAQPSGQVRKLLEITGAWQEFRGESPGEQRGAAAPARRATPAASVTAAEDGPEVADSAEVAEAEEGAAAGVAPEAPVEDAEEETSS
ncbi:MAG TPA: 30S ribosomal protein S16 [Actinomycetota bacterium]|jgi:small subunit ribosomal protein S16|nr:30S ribosomal protein S16 [Actinomycetota bacterium]